MHQPHIPTSLQSPKHKTSFKTIDWIMGHIYHIAAILAVAVACWWVITHQDQVWNLFQAQSGQVASSSVAVAPVVAAAPTAADLLREIAQHEAAIIRLRALLPTPTPPAANGPNPIITLAVEGVEIIITFPPGYRGGTANVTGGPIQAGTCPAPDRVGRSPYFYPSEKGCQMFAPLGVDIKFLHPE